MRNRQACPELHRLYMGPQVRTILLGWHESVSILVRKAPRFPLLQKRSLFSCLFKAAHPCRRSPDFQGLDYYPQGPAGRAPYHC
jgi:hypothetical protein